MSLGAFMNNVHNFEDAKRYLENDIDGAYDRKIRRTARRQALFIGGLGNVVLLVVAAASGHMEFAWLVPGLIAWASCAYLNVIRRWADKMAIKSGAYFRIKSESEVISQSNKQIAAANEEEMRKS